MSLLDVLRSGVKTAHNVTKPLQVSTTFQRYTGSDAFGTKTYKSAVPLTVIEDWKQMQVRTKDGQLATSRASVLFLDVKALLDATSRVTDTSGLQISAAGMIFVDDRIGLSDGTFPPILSLAGFIDAGTHAPVATHVYF
jgi:hypothetical protein